MYCWERERAQWKELTIVDGDAGPRWPVLDRPVTARKRSVLLFQVPVISSMSPFTETWNGAHPQPTQNQLCPGESYFGDSSSLLRILQGYGGRRQGGRALARRW